MSTLKVNTVESATTPTVLISDGLSVSGVSTLTGGLKVGTAVTISDNGNFGITGIMTASNFVGGGAGLTGLTAGITMADIYRLHTTLSLTYDTVHVITSNWERPDQSDDVFDKIGTGMSQSSGIFTFPTTGIYLVTYIARLYGTSDSGANHIYLDATVNNSDYNTVAQSASGLKSNQQMTIITQTMVDITDTSNRKLRFKVYAGGSNQQLLGNTNKNETFVTFIRLGDT